MPGLDAEAMEVPLAELTRRRAPDVHAVLIRDGAGRAHGASSTVV